MKLKKLKISNEEKYALFTKQLARFAAQMAAMLDMNQSDVHVFLIYNVMRVYPLNTTSLDELRRLAYEIGNKTEKTIINYGKECFESKNIPVCAWNLIPESPWYYHPCIAKIEEVVLKTKDKIDERMDALIKNGMV